MFSGKTGIYIYILCLTLSIKPRLGFIQVSDLSHKTFEAPVYTCTRKKKHPANQHSASNK